MYGCKMSLTTAVALDSNVRLGKINPCLLLEIKNITHQLIQNDRTRDSRFLFGDTPLGIFDFCLGIKALKESRLSVVLFIGEIDSYVP